MISLVLAFALVQDPVTQVRYAELVKCVHVRHGANTHTHCSIVTNTHEIEKDGTVVPHHISEEIWFRHAHPELTKFVGHEVRLEWSTLPADAGDGERPDECATNEETGEPCRLEKLVSIRASE